MGSDAVKSGNSRLILFCLAFALAGVVAGWAIFHLPEAACGPLRSEIAAEWIGAMGGLVVAGATLWAVLVAIGSARQATYTALAIRRSEVDEEQKKLLSMRLRFSVIFRNELLMLGHQLARLAQDLDAAASSKDVASAKVYLIDRAPKVGLTLLSRFSNDLYAFPPEPAGAMALALWRWNAIQERPEFILDSDNKTLTLAASFSTTLKIAVTNLQAAFSALEPFIPFGTHVSQLEQQFGNVAEPYAPSPVGE